MSVLIVDVRGTDAAGRLHQLTHAIPMLFFIGAKNPAHLMWYEARIMQRKITQHLCVTRLHWSAHVEAGDL